MVNITENDIWNSICKDFKFNNGVDGRIYMAVIF